ncbi:hypothetical protein SUREIYA_00430 [Serratia phage vB_SmaM-Sureiya]|nr:hypothetical protein SUREIYA_00430 [Serratia phage vB_SmaM-Sureiya]
MNTLSYLSLMSQSLVRYDMANDMLKWAQAISKTKLAKRNFRQLKKFLQIKGYEYTRPYPYKGKERCTVSLLDIVRENNTKEFLELHGGVEGVAKSMARLVGTGIPTQPGDELITENATFKFLKEGTDLAREVDVRLSVPDLQNLIEKRFNGNLSVTEVKSWMPPSQESVDEVNKILKDVIEGRVEGNPFDLYSVVHHAKPPKGFIHDVDVQHMYLTPVQPLNPKETK